MTNRPTQSIASSDGYDSFRYRRMTSAMPAQVTRIGLPTRTA